MLDLTREIPKIEVANVSLRFVSPRGEAEVLRDVSLRIEPGEFVSIVGASGCGKTTLLRVIDGIIRPLSGAVLLDGVQIKSPGPERAFVFQQDALFPWRSIIKNVVLGLEVSGVRKSQSYPRAQELLNLVGLNGFEDHHPHELSGGMRQRANLARALAVDPDVLLMDEPFASLDAQTRELMQAELLRIWQLTEKTVIFVTHQIDEAVYLSDRVVVMSARPGRVKEVIEVDLDRPRDLSIKRTSDFAVLVDKIWRLIEEEVKLSLSELT